MPGGFAHITAVNELAGTERFDALDMPGRAKLAVKRFLRYCELGAVSPDYPYFAITLGGDHKVWADLMHYRFTADIIKAGIPRVAALTGDDQEKALAWLLGYTAHVALDLSIHPIVERRIGPYYGNAGDHQICEINQDVYIFQRMNLGELRAAGYLNAGLAQCNQDGMDPIIAVWRGMFEETYPKNFKKSPPDIAKWHSGYSKVLSTALTANEYGEFFAPVARYLGGESMLFPSPANVDRSYIADLDTPEGPMHYDAIFDRGVGNIGLWWEAVANAVFGDDSKIGRLVNGDLDNGRLEGGYAFWTPAPAEAEPELAPVA